MFVGGLVKCGVRLCFNNSSICLGDRQIVDITGNRIDTILGDG